MLSIDVFNFTGDLYAVSRCKYLCTLPSKSPLFEYWCDIKPMSVNSETTYRADLKTYYREVELILHPATISALVWLLVADSHVTAWYRGAGGM